MGGRPKCFAFVRVHDPNIVQLVPHFIDHIKFEVGVAGGDVKVKPLNGPSKDNAFKNGFFETEFNGQDKVAISIVFMKDHIALMNKQKKIVDKSFARAEYDLDHVIDKDANKENEANDIIVGYKNLTYQKTTDAAQVIQYDNLQIPISVLQKANISL